ncbi:MAG: T9SS type A sorting domain-containing protein [Candidatus Kapaibacterium sp.]
MKKAILILVITLYALPCLSIELKQITSIDYTETGGYFLDIELYKEGFLLMGFNSYHNLEKWYNREGFIIRFDKDGMKLWDRTPEIHNRRVTYQNIKIKDNGNILFMGKASLDVNEYFNAGDYLVLKEYDEDGNLVFENADSSAGYVNPNIFDNYHSRLGLTNKPVTFYSETGMTWKYHKSFSIKYDDRGNYLEHLLFDPGYNNGNKGSKLLIKDFQTAYNNGYYLVCGIRGIKNIINDTLRIDTVRREIIKTDDECNIIWSAHFDERLQINKDDTYSGDIKIHYINEENDEFIASFRGGGNYIMKADQYGAPVWKLFFHDDNGSYLINKVIPCNAGGYMVAGYFASAEYDGEGFIARVSEDGEFLWEHIEKSPGQHCVWEDIIEADTNSFLVLERYNDYTGRVYEFTDDISPVIDYHIPEMPYTYESGRYIFPEGSRIRVFDIYGREIKNLTVNNIINENLLSAGAYLVNLSNSGRTRTVKILVNR